MSEKSPSIHNDRAGRPTGKGLCFKPTTNVVETKESAPTSRAKDRLQLKEAKAQLHNIRNQTLADVEKIIDEEGEIIPCGKCNTFGEVDGETNLALDGYDLHTCEICEGEGTILVIRKNVLKEEIKNLEVKHG